MKQPIYKKKPYVTYSVALVLAFLAAEKKNRQLEDLALVDFGRLPNGSHGLGILLKKLLEIFALKTPGI